MKRPVVSILSLLSVLISLTVYAAEQTKVLNPMLFLLLNSSSELPDGTVISAGQVWMDRNLGASRVATSFTDSEAYGDMYQWGRGTDGHEKRNSPTTSIKSNTDTPGHGSFIIIENKPPWDWRTTQNNNLWQGETGINNPCPSGFRLPTFTEFETERSSWNSNNRDGAYASPAKFPTAGHRVFTNGQVVSGGVGIGNYWSSTTLWSSNFDHYYTSNLYFHVSDSNMIYNYSRAWGLSVRCIMD
jgi:uncharacterized protein (TIGR02145 family)